MLTFDNNENSLNDMTIQIKLKKDLGMTLRHGETQATTIGETQATMTGETQTKTIGVTQRVELHPWTMAIDILRTDYDKLP